MPCFQRMTSATASASNPAAVRSAAIRSATLSIPSGYRPTRNTPGERESNSSTTPGSRCCAGIHDIIPYTRSLRSAASGSATTPFCAHTIAAPRGIVASAPGTSCDLTARSTTSSAPSSVSSADATRGILRVSVPDGRRNVNPRAAIASPCAPRATTTTSRPASSSRQAMAPPTAPAPTITYFTTRA